MKFYMATHMVAHVLCEDHKFAHANQRTTNDMKAYNFIFVAVTLTSSFTQAANWYDGLMSYLNHSDEDYVDDWLAPALFPNDESPDVYEGKVSVHEAHDPVNLSLPEALQSISEARQKQLIHAYFAPENVKPEAPPKHLNEDDLLFLMYYYGQYLEKRRWWTFDLDDIKKVDRMNIHIVLSSNNKSVTANQFYLEALCRIAEMDYEVDAVLEAFSNSIKDKVLLFSRNNYRLSFLPLVSFKKFKNQIDKRSVREMLLEAVKNPHASEREIIDLEAISLLDESDIRLSLAYAIKFNREELFKRLGDVYVDSFIKRSFKNSWPDITNHILSVISRIENELGTEANLNEAQLRMIDKFMQKAGKLSRSATLLLKTRLDKSQHPSQISERFKAYFVKFARNDFKKSRNDWEVSDFYDFLKILINDPQFSDQDIISTDLLDSYIFERNAMEFLNQAFDMNRVELIEKMASKGPNSAYLYASEVIVRCLKLENRKITGYRNLTPAQVKIFNFLIDEMSNSPYCKDFLDNMRLFLNGATKHN